MTGAGEEPRRGVALAAFVGVCLLADASPLLKLRPPSVVYDALVGGADRGTASSLFAAFAVATLAAPALALWCVARTRLLSTDAGARPVGALVVLGMLAAMLAMGHRVEGLRAIGRGSDQAACIEMPARALAAGHWPYDRALIWSGSPCSPGLGWIALALPFVLLAGYATFVVAGAALFVALPERVVGISARAVAAMLVLVASCVAAWQSLVTGADDLAIGIALALVTALSARPRLTLVVAVAAGLIATSRLPFAFVPVALAAQLHAGGERRRAAMFAVVSLGTLLIAHGAGLAFNLESYVADGPLHVLRKGARLVEDGGTSFFAASAVAWLVYAAVTLGRPPGPASIQFRVATLTLLCVLGPALTDLVSRPTADSLQGWQGGNWLLATLPCYAMSLAITLGASAPAASPPAGTSSPPAT